MTGLTNASVIGPRLGALGRMGSVFVLSEARLTPEGPRRRAAVKDLIVRHVVD